MILKNKHLFYLSFVLFSCVCFSQTSKQSTVSNNLKMLFKQGDDGYACFRIPAVVVTKKGTIIAFAEARKKSCSDTGNIDLVMKKSTNNGKTWGKLKVIWDDGANVCGNPNPIVDLETGEIHLLSTWNYGGDHEPQIIAGTSKFSREIYHQTSKDDGETWSVPKNITKSVKLPNWTWYATGPVHGIQLKKGKHKGRLMAACDHIEKDSKKYFSHVIYSDDHGISWKLGGTTPKDQVNESTVVELENGRLLLNMRNYDRNAKKARQTAISKDGGDTWIEQQFDDELPEPRCQGALLSVKKKGKQLLLFTNPAAENSRVNMTLSISNNGGESWDNKIVIYPKHSAYSDLAQLKNGNIFVFYEAGYISPYDGICYKIIPKKNL